MPHNTPRPHSGSDDALFETSSIASPLPTRRFESARRLPAHARNIVTAYYSDDTSPLLDMMTDDCLFINEVGTLFSSKEELRRTLERRAASHSMLVRETDFKLAHEVEADRVGVTATVIGSYRLYTSPRDRSLHASMQLISACFVLTDQGWKAFHIHTSNKQSETVDESVFPLAISRETYDYVREILRTGVKAGILPSRLHLENNEGSRLLGPEQIMYVEAKGKHSIVHCVGSSFSANSLISDVESQVPGTFLRVHRSYLVNTSHISGIRKYSLELTDGTEIPIPKRRYVEVRREIALRATAGLNPSR